MPADAAHAALDPEARQLLQELASARRPSVRLLPIEAARRQFDATFAGMPRQPVSSVADLEIDLPGRVRIWARCSRPREGRPPPLGARPGGGGLAGGPDLRVPSQGVVADGGEPVDGRVVSPGG